MASEQDPKTCGKEKVFDRDDHKNFYRSPFMDSSRSYLLQKKREHQRTGGYSYKSYEPSDPKTCEERKGRVIWLGRPSFPAVKEEEDSSSRKSYGCVMSPLFQGITQRKGKELMQFVDNNHGGYQWNLKNRDNNQGMSSKETFKNSLCDTNRAENNTSDARETESEFPKGNIEGFKRDLYKGKGAVEVYSSGEFHTINNVYYIPTLRRNVLSVGKLEGQGFKITFEGDICHIRRNPLWKGKEKQIEYDPISEPIIHCWTCNDHHPGYNCPYSAKDVDEVPTKKFVTEKLKRKKAASEERQSDFVKNALGNSEEGKEKEHEYHKETDPSFEEEDNMIYPKGEDPMENCMLLMDMIYQSTQIKLHRIKIKAEFERMISWFLNGFLNFSGRMPIPPVDHLGRKVDLMDLYMTVERFGGFEAVNKHDLWTQVAVRMGYGLGLMRMKKDDDIVK